jgi:hypothetical protein
MEWLTFGQNFEIRHCHLFLIWCVLTPQSTLHNLWNRWRSAKPKSVSRDGDDNIHLLCNFRQFEAASDPKYLWRCTGIHAASTASVISEKCFCDKTSESCAGYHSNNTYEPVSQRSIKVYLCSSLRHILEKARRGVHNRIWSWVPWGLEPEISVLARASRNLAVSHIPDLLSWPPHLLSAT